MNPSTQSPQPIRTTCCIAGGGPEEMIFPILRELGIGVTAYGVLSRGLLSGSKTTGKGDYRAHLPRFTGENAERNRALVEALEALAAEKEITATQLAIAWVLPKGDNIVPVIGARTRPARRIPGRPPGLVDARRPRTHRRGRPRLRRRRLPLRRTADADAR